MIAVTGATGHLGRIVVEKLLAKVPPRDVVALVRDPGKAADLAAAGVQVRVADYAKPETLGPALAGVEKLLLISSSEVGKRAEQHLAVVKAAKKEGVRLIAYTSILHAGTSKLLLAAEHKATEDAIRASGLPYVFLRNGWYFENYTENLAPALEHGALAGAARDGRIAAATRADFAEAAVAVLTGPGPVHHVYELAGDVPFTMAGLAAEVSRHAGRKIVYADMPKAQYKAVLVGAGLPEGYAEALADSDVGISQGELDDSTGDLHRLIGRPTTTLAVAVKAAFAR